MSPEAFLATVDKTVKCRGFESLKAQTDDADHCEALDEVLRVCNAAGFKITTIECDGSQRSVIDRLVCRLNLFIELWRGFKWFEP